MAIQGEQFLDVANWIYKNNSKNEEICYRCSVNRAYYAAFHVAKRYLKLPKRTTHKETIILLKRNIAPAGEMLGTLYEARRDADYDLTQYVSRAKADECIKQAVRIIKKIDSKSK
jgi:uncharacterized protein (UPF0332 family)